MNTDNGKKRNMARWKNSKPMTEAEVQADIRRKLDSIGAVHIRQMAGAITRGKRVVARTQLGVSDLICCIPYRLDELEAMGLDQVGVFVAIETKPEGWKPPGEKAIARRHYEQQLRFIRKVRASGGFGFFASDPGVFVRELLLGKHFLV